MLGHNWYFQTIKKYTTIFGLLFDNINISRTDDAGNEIQAMKVPLSYAGKDKILARLKQDPAIDRQPAITLPRMSFEMSSLYYNGDRKLDKIGKLVIKGDDADSAKIQFNPVPYNFDFRLYVYVKNTEDGLKIVEQIMPFFVPDYTVTAHLIPEMNVTRDIPISLKNVTMEDIYEGNYLDLKNRTIIWTLDFNLQGYIYGPVMPKPLIKFVKTNFRVAATTADYSNTVQLPVDTITVQPGLTTNGEPTSNATLSINVDDIWVDDDWGVVKIIT